MRMRNVVGPTVVDSSVLIGSQYHRGNHDIKSHSMNALEVSSQETRIQSHWLSSWWIPWLLLVMWSPVTGLRRLCATGQDTADQIWLPRFHGADDGHRWRWHKPVPSWWCGPGPGRRRFTKEFYPLQLSRFSEDIGAVWVVVKLCHNSTGTIIRFGLRSVHISVPSDSTNSRQAWSTGAC